MKVISKKGVEINYNDFIERKGATMAVGNANMNARGDTVGRGGVIVKSREEKANEYYASPKAVSAYRPLSDIADEVMSLNAAADSLPAAPSSDQADIPPSRRKRQSSESEN